MSAPRILLRRVPFGGVLALGMLLGGAGLAVAAYLCLRVLVPLASSCLQACAANPTLMALARAGAGLGVAVVGSGLLVALVALVNQLAATRRLVRRVEARAAMPPRPLERMAARLGLLGRLIYVDDPAVYAFCYGFLSPRICVSAGMVRTLTCRELRAVLLHESYHLRHRDPLKVLASRMVAGALFLLPVAADLRDRYLVQKELAADARVVEELSPRPLAGALLKICRGSGQRPVAALAAAAVGPFNVVGERIRRLAHPSEPLAPLRGRRIAMSLAVVVVVLGVSVGSAFGAERSLPAGLSCCASTGGLCDVSGGGPVAQQ